MRRRKNKILSAEIHVYRCSDIIMLPTLKNVDKLLVHNKELVRFLRPLPYFQGQSSRKTVNILSAQYLVNQWLDSYQIFMDIFLGQQKKSTDQILMTLTYFSRSEQ